MSHIKNVTQASNATKEPYDMGFEAASNCDGEVCHRDNAEIALAYEIEKETVRTNDVTHKLDDQRLAPKQKKHIALWQYYLLQQELVEFKKRHTLRMKSAQAGKSNFSPEMEQFFIEHFQLDIHISPKNKAEREQSFFSAMVKAGQEVGPIWDWLLDHKGIGESLAAKVLALINDIEKFDTVAKLWRYSGYGLNEYWCDENSKAICPKEGWKWVTTGKGRYRVWTIVSQKCDVTQTPDVNNNNLLINETQQHHVNTNGSSQNIDVTQLLFAIPQDKQYAIPQNKDLPELKRVDFLEPDPAWQLKTLSDRLCKGYHAPYCTPLKSTLFLVAESFMKQSTVPYRDLYDAEKERLTDLHTDKKKGHIHNMALRKMKKEFLKQLWLTWRQLEGLPIGEGWK